MRHPAIIISQQPAVTSDFSAFAAVINVADSPCRTFEVNGPSFWFPVHETGRWGYAPFYGAAKVIDHFREIKKPILVHCHGGVNRSPSVVYAILASDGLSDGEIVVRYPLFGLAGMHEIYYRNVHNHCIERDTISMLAARHNYPTYSLCGLLGVIKSPNIFHLQFLQSLNYYKCLGCGAHINADQERGKCEICGAQHWLACTAP